MRYDLVVPANPVWEKAWLLDAIPEQGIRPGEDPPARSSLADGGGSALNTACALAMAGRRVLAAGQVGDDEDGRAALAALHRRGVETHVAICAGRTTKRNHLYVDGASHETAFQVFVPERVALPWEDEPPGIREASVLLLDRLAVRAREWLGLRRGLLGRVNFLSRNSSLGTPATEERFRRALPMIDILQLPEGHSDSPPAPAAAAASGAQPKSKGGGSAGSAIERNKVHHPAPGRPLSPAEAEDILQAGVHVLMRTRGPEGVLLQIRTSPAGSSPCRCESRSIPARPTELLDPTGAGDAFTAGCIDALLDARSPVEAAERGVEWAARACRYLGARGWLDHEPP